MTESTVNDVDFAKLLVNADTEAALEAGPDPLVWTPKDHVNRVHLAVPLHHVLAKRDGGGEYPVLKLRHLIVFHQTRAGKPMVYRYDQVRVSQRLLRRTWGHLQPGKVAGGVLTCDNPEHAFPAWQVKQCSDEEHERLVTWLKANSSRDADGNLLVHADGDNQVVMFDEDDEPHM